VELLNLEPKVDEDRTYASLLEDKEVEVILRKPGLDETILPVRLRQVLASATSESAAGHAISISRTEEYESPASAAKKLGVSRTMVVRWINEGLLADEPVGSDHRIPTSSVLGLQTQRIAAGQRAMVLVANESPETKDRLEAARARARRRMANR
jgi:hypothetical protein